MVRTCTTPLWSGYTAIAGGHTGDRTFSSRTVIQLLPHGGVTNRAAQSGDAASIFFGVMRNLSTQ